MSADRRGRLGLALSALSVLLVLADGLLGPSVVVLHLAGDASALPPYSPGPGLGAWPSVLIASAAVVAGAAGIALCLSGLRRGWRPSTRRIAATGVLAAALLTLVPPMASADVLMYAGYGRIAALGLDPYTVTPADLAARTGDPVASATEAPWQDTPSVYGPLVTGLQRVASELGGTSMHDTVFWLQVENAAFFVGAGLLVLAMARRGRGGSGPSGVPTGADGARAEPDDDAPARAAILFLANPLLLFAVVAGGHNEPVSLALALAALALLHRSRGGAGMLLGAAGLAKLTIGLWGLALVWTVRRDRRAVAALIVGAAVVLVPAYGIAGPHALDQVRANASYVASGTVWRPVRSLLDLVLPFSAANALVGLASWVLFAVLVVALARTLAPSRVAPLTPSDPTPEAGRAIAVVAIAWLFAGTYTLPWYDATAWAPLALLAPSLMDRLMLLRTEIVTLAYVPGRVVPVPRGLDVAYAAVIRSALAPAAMAAIIGAVLVRWRRPAGPGPAPVPAGGTTPGRPARTPRPSPSGSPAPRRRSR